LADAGRDDRSDEQLASQAQAGCLSSFETLAMRFQTPLLAFLVQRCGGRADAEDLVQDTFLRAYRSLHRYDPRRRFGTWLFTIAHRLAMNHHRDRAGEATTHSSIEIVACDRSDPAAAAVANEQCGRLWAAAREALDDARFTMLWLRVVEDMEHAQIARVLGRSSVSVRVELHRARKLVRKRLAAAESAGRGTQEMSHVSFTAI
jgi:RNA polymerase sigma-70 factor (ECF subfamily)